MGFVLLYFLIEAAVAVTSSTPTNALLPALLSAGASLSDSNKTSTISHANGVILLGSGTYSGPLNCGLIIASGSVQIVGAGTDLTIIDCGSQQTPCLTIAGASTFVNVTGITFANGIARYVTEDADTHSIGYFSSDDILQPQSMGGCILVTNGSSVSVSSCVVKGCSGIKGGGIAVMSGSTLVMSNNTIVSENVAHSLGDSMELACGGGLYCSGGSSITISQSQFLRNVAGQDNPLLYYSYGVAGGGGMFANDCLVDISDVILSENVLSVGINSEMDGIGLQIWNCNGVLVRNVSTSNNIEYCGTGSYMSGTFTVYFSSSMLLEDILIENNTIVSCLTYGAGLDLMFSSSELSSNPDAAPTSKLWGAVRNLTLRGNTVQSPGEIPGGWMRVRDITGLVIDGMYVEDNMCIYATYAQGCGLQVVGATNVSISNFVVRNNTITLDNDAGRSDSGIPTCPPLERATVLNVPVPGPPGVQQCVVLSEVQSTCGTLTSGNIWGTHYPTGLDCSWLLTTTSFAQSISLSFNFSIDFMEMAFVADCSVDALAIFDGSSTSAPLIGKWCGGGSSGPITCGAGRCLGQGTIIVTSGGTALLQLTSTVGGYSGYNISWNAIAQQDAFATLAASSAAVLPLATGLPNMLIEVGVEGGGVSIVTSTNIVLLNGVISDNLASHSTQSWGGGMLILTRCSVLMVNISIVNNLATALVCGGGGLAVFDNSIASMMNVVVDGNVANAGGSCFVLDGTRQFGVGWGGGVLAATTSTLTVMGGLMSNNSAQCSRSSSSSSGSSGGSINSGLSSSSLSSCASAGGGIVVSGSSQVHLNTSVQLVMNSAPTGGGAYVSGGSGSSIIMSGGVSCSSNVASCALLAGEGNNTNGGVGGVCTSSGGCVSIDSGSVWASASVILGNVAMGAGGGGGIDAAGTAFVAVVNGSAIGLNAAQEGGGIRGDDSAVLIFNGIVIHENSAQFVGGGLSLGGSVAISMSNMSLLHNTAIQASAVWGFGANLIYSLSSVTIVAGEGNQGTFVGTLQLTDVIWNCTQDGSVTQVTGAAGAQFVSVTCVVCGAGTYSVGTGSSLLPKKSVCNACTVGGTCTGASLTNASTTTSSSGLLALSGYWGLANTTTGTVDFYSCPPGYCCQPGNNNCDFDYCAGNRTGLLCGQCTDGLGQRLFTDGCVDNRACNDAGWFSVVVGIGATLLAAILVRNGRVRNTSGIGKVVLFFYQTLPLIKFTPWTYTIPTLMSILGSVSSVTPSVSSAGGVCLTTDLSAAGKMRARLAITGSVVLAIAALFLLHSGASCILFGTLRGSHEETQHSSNKSIIIMRWMKRHPPSPSQYIAVITRFASIVYTALALAALQTLQCIQMGDVFVWWYDTSTICYAWWQLGGFALLAVLVPLPLVAMWIVVKWSRRRESSTQQQWQHAVCGVLASGFRRERGWWLGVSLYRRLSLVLVFALIQDPLWRVFANSSLFALFVTLQARQKPFAVIWTNRLEMVSLVCACLLAMSGAPEYLELQKLSESQSSSTAPAVALEWVQLILAVTPGITGLAVYGIHNRRKLRGLCTRCGFRGTQVDPSDGVRGETEPRMLFLGSDPLDTRRNNARQQQEQHIELAPSQLLLQTENAQLKRENAKAKEQNTQREEELQDQIALLQQQLAHASARSDELLTFISSCKLYLC